MIAGLAQPTFNQRKIEHDIRLKESEVNLLGGLIETKETESVSGLPGLSQIPLLGYLFSSQHRERIETEVLVMLTPRVIRLPERLPESGREVPVGVGGPAPTVPTTPEAETPPRPEGAPEQPLQPQ
jgi:general secretion pathway protein D